MGQFQFQFQLSLFLLICVVIFFFFPAANEAASSNNATTCPVNLDYVLKIPWNKTTCKNYIPSTNDTSNSQNDITSLDPCCRSLLSLFGVGLAKHLTKTNLFQLPDLPTSISCLSDFQSKLTSLSLPDDVLSHCFDPMQFVLTPNICAHVQTYQDWVAILGKSTDLDSACKPDLVDLTACSSCVAAGFKVQSELMLRDGNKSHTTDCFYYTVLYAAGFVNDFGPESNGAVTCIFGLDLNSDLGSHKGHNSAKVFGLTGAVVAVLVMSSLLGLYYWYSKKWREKKSSSSFSPFDLEEQGTNSRPKLRPNTGSIWFKIHDLEKATDNFSHKNFLGKGGFGFVYKGVLSDGTIVAVKRVIESDFQGDAEFRNEVEIISNLKHRNLVPLRGCCVVDEDDDYSENGSQRYLVYDYMPNGNLDDHLFPSSSDSQIEKKLLTWPQRKNIILDVAKGLAYLHYGVKPGIYHRDIKATNILLDADMRARVADFGLAKQSREGQSHLTTRVAGTHGYLAPEYALYGQLTERSDVYSFGIVLLEIMCGRKALNFSSSGDSPHAFLITDWVWSLVKTGKSEAALDPFLLQVGESSTSNPKAIMERFVLVGILCAHVMVALRPTILEALKMLEGDTEVPVIPDRPIPLSHPSSFGDGSTFSISPALSFPQLHSGEMLRHF